MFRNRYNVWSCSSTLCGHPRRKSSKSADVYTSTNSSPFVLSYLYFQVFAFLQFQATRAVSEHSVPIIVCITVGAGHIIRLFGPESLGGIGDIAAKIDAEIARTGLSDDEIGHKVHIISHHASRRNIWSSIRRYTTIQKGNSFGFLAFL